MPKILLTRPKELSLKIKKQLQINNLLTSIQPLFTIDQNTEITKQDFINLQAIILTSTNAVFALQKLSFKKNTLILAIGKKNC